MNLRPLAQSILFAALGVIPLSAQTTVLYANTFTTNFSAGESGTLGGMVLLNSNNGTAQTSSYASTGNATVNAGTGELNLSLSATGLTATSKNASSIFTLASAGSPTTPYDFYSEVAGKKYIIEFTAYVNPSTATDRLRVYWDNADAINATNLGNSELSMKLGVLTASGTSLSNAGVKLLGDARYNLTNTTSSQGTVAHTYRFEIDETGATPTYAFFVDGDTIPQFYDTAGNPVAAPVLTAFGSNNRYLYLDLFDNTISSSSAPNALARIDNLSISVVTAIPEPSTYAAMAGVLALGLAAWRRRKAA